jgi:hypothetical protein
LAGVFQLLLRLQVTAHYRVVDPVFLLGSECRKIGEAFLDQIHPLYSSESAYSPKFYLLEINIDV